MIAGIGTDIIEIERINKALLNTPQFMEKSFTIKEREYFKLRKDAVESIAGNFAAKEAVSKALGTGFRGFGLMDIEILRDDLGRPVAFLHGKAQHIGKEKDIVNIWVSISHCKVYATAYAIAEKGI